MARPKITLYVDTVSPFGYLAYYVLRHDAAFRSCEITYVPIFLGGLMKQCENTPPIKIKNKDKWTNKERRRWAAAFNVPMKQEMPPGFPPLTLGIMRHLCALRQLDGNQDRLVRGLDVLYQEYWVEHTALHQPEVLQAVLEKVLGASDARKVAQMAGNEGKVALVENTERAFTHGAFGLPWMVCTSSTGGVEGFWGVDRLEQAAMFLGLPPPSRDLRRALL